MIVNLFKELKIIVINSCKHYNLQALWKLKITEKIYLFEDFIKILKT